MSYDFNAYFRRENFPTIALLREHLKRAGNRVVIDDDVDFLTAGGWVDVVLDGTPTGFEVFSGEVDDDSRARYRARLARNQTPPDQFLRILESCDFDLNFNCKDDREVAAARLVMTVIATATNGWLSDPQNAITIRLGNFRARLRYGNPHAPFGIGAYTVTIGVDDNVELVHEQGGKRRRWIARAEPALVTTLAAGLASANFPARPSQRVGRPGTSTFELEVPRMDGTIERAGGFPSPNYRDVAFMFTRIVSQMSGDAVLGFLLPIETLYVSNAKEVGG
jgi:hypothetical protein